jgi:hypothetical protein
VGKTEVRRELSLDAFDHLKKILLRHTYSVITIFLLIFVLGISLSLFNLTEPLSLLIMLSVTIMFAGQVLLITPFSVTYPFYLASFFEAIYLSVFFWLSSHVPSFELSVLIFSIVVVALIAVPLTIHWLTKKILGTIPMIPVFSIFFFGLMITLSNAKTVSSSTYDTLFLLTVVLFILTSIFGMNMAYRTSRLNRELKISDRIGYLRKVKDALLKKYTTPDVHSDIDLLTYYLSSSLDSFAYGDFDRSYMDAFKIIDNRGTAFKTIYTLPLNEEQWKHLSDIRNNLSHARISEGRKDEAEEKEMLRKLRKLRKELFRETLELLKIVRFQFLDAASKNEDSVKESSSEKNTKRL